MEHLDVGDEAQHRPTSPPPKGRALLSRAADYGASRMVCGMHFRTDVVAGQVLGTAVALEVLRVPAFRADRDAAPAELRAAHLAP